MTKNDFISTIRETERLLISLTNSTQDFDTAVMELLRGLETILVETENSTDIYKSGVGEFPCLVFDKERED